MIYYLSGGVESPPIPLRGPPKPRYLDQKKAQNRPIFAYSRGVMAP